MGLLVSARVRSSVTSIVVCLVLWVSFVFIIPNAAIYLAQSFVKPTEDNLRLASAISIANTGKNAKLAGITFRGRIG